MPTSDSAPIRTAQTDPGSVAGKSAAEVARHSLASLHALRARFLPLLVQALPEDAEALAALLAREMSAWMAADFPPALLPPAILRSNLAGFLLHALELSALPADAQAALAGAWFDDPRSPLAGHARWDAERGRMVRRPCCLRDRAGVVRCGTCPRRAAA